MIQHEKTGQIERERETSGRGGVKRKSVHEVVEKAGN